MRNQIEESGDRWQEWFKSSQYYTYPGGATAAGDRTVESDRQKWVAGYVAKGLPLQRVLEVFAPFLEPEVTRYYKQAQAEADN